MDLAENLGQLKASGWTSVPVKEEMRRNAIAKIQSGEPLFDGVMGYENTVAPQLENALLAGHDVVFLGERGQAKTRMIRSCINLLDEYMPIIAGSEINDDPLNPVSKYAKDLVAEHGDDTKIAWVHRSARFAEKLATPDTSIADLIGEVDPIKVAEGRYLSDELTLHYGMVPRSNRGLFAMNELPDLAERIQVGLLNVLEERDVQIRGYRIQLPIDVVLFASANPEDYTNRGAIITPLKDRIESQILTHYPKSIEIARSITEQEAKIEKEQSQHIYISELLKILLERISFEARESEFIDEKSGVSARLSIAGYENLMSTAERRKLLNKEKKTTVRITDFWGVIPAITGKVELVYEGEQEGPYNVALALLSKAIKTEFLNYFPHPEKLKKGQQKDPYGTLRAFFSAGNTVDFFNDMSDKHFKKELDKVAGLRKLVEPLDLAKEDEYNYMELALHGLAEFNIVNKDMLDSKLSFRDLLANMFDDMDEGQTSVSTNNSKNIIGARFSAKTRFTIKSTLPDQS